jgi:hypothetical protein
MNCGIKVAGVRWGSEPGIFWFRLFSHSITFLLSHSGTPVLSLFEEKTLEVFFIICQPLVSTTALLLRLHLSSFRLYLLYHKPTPSCAYPHSLLPFTLVDVNLHVQWIVVKNASDSNYCRVHSIENFWDLTFQDLLIRRSWQLLRKSAFSLTNTFCYGIKTSKCKLS